MAEEEKLRIALQKIADLPATQQGNRGNPMLRAKRIALAALGANQKAVEKFKEDRRRKPAMSLEDKTRLLARAVLNFASFTRQVYTDQDGDTAIGEQITNCADISLVEALEQIAK